jgi:lysozyme family protein
MQHPFVTLGPEYQTHLSQMTMTRETEARRVAARLIRYRTQYYDPVSARTGIVVPWIAASFERESSSDFRCSPAQGDRWDRVSIHVPRGRGPFVSWMAAAIDAYHLDGQDQVGAANWTWARACYEAEAFNGWGYLNRGIPSPYVWAGTSIYSHGKFTSDGHFDASAVDEQLGVVPIMVELIKLDPTLAMADTLAVADAEPAAVAPRIAAPVGIGGAPEHDTAWLQKALSALGETLDVDGDYGRQTRFAVRTFQSANHLSADGLAGPLTMAAIEQTLADHEITIGA